MTLPPFTAAFWDFLATSALSGAILGLLVAVVVLIDLIIKRRPKGFGVVFIVISYLLQGILIGAAIGAMGYLAFYFARTNGLWIGMGILIVALILWLRAYIRANGFFFCSPPVRQTEHSLSEASRGRRNGGE